MSGGSGSGVGRGGQEGPGDLCPRGSLCTQCRRYASPTRDPRVVPFVSLSHLMQSRREERGKEAAPRAGGVCRVGGRDRRGDERGMCGRRGGGRGPEGQWAGSGVGSGRGLDGRWAGRRGSGRDRE